MLPLFCSSAYGHYLTIIYSLQCKKFQESDEAEMISAMAGGWNHRLIVKGWILLGLKKVLEVKKDINPHWLFLPFVSTFVSVLPMHLSMSAFLLLLALPLLTLRTT
ncbi:hypothetical protein L1887_09940 [Cichorium endivia]|nr:hypothetical protein L1887_09940 [Cichorium endivia]